MIRHMNALLTCLTVGCCTAQCLAGPPIEVSDDGHLTVIVQPSESDGSGSSSGEVPYPLEPDWENDIRRQVGGLQVADMNNDGLLDVVVGCYHSNSFPPYDDWPTYIYFNIGGELEAQPSWISTDEVSTGDVQVADFNNDGYLDIFAANGGFAMDSSVIYWGGEDGPSTSPGWFSNEPDDAWNNYALPIDIDHDGDIDVITANQGNSQFDPYRPMYIFYNDDGDLSTTPGWTSRESSIQNYLAAGDFDGDGWEDIAVSVNFESGVYRNTKGAIETPPYWTTGDDGDDKGVGWADVNLDGLHDLAIGHDPTRVYSNDGKRNLALYWEADDTLFHGHSELRWEDVDMDGDPDLAEIHFSNGFVNIYLNNDGVLDDLPSWTYDSPHVGTAIAFGDINGDGAPDLVVGNAGEVSVSVFYNLNAPSCPADATGDGVVNTKDLLGLLGAWGTDDPDYDIAGDDNVVNTTDLLAMLGAWGPCP